MDKRPANDSSDADWRDLHEKREALERALSLAQARQRFAKDPVDAADAGRDETELLQELDRLLTRIRAAEYGRQPGARRW